MSETKWGDYLSGRTVKISDLNEPVDFRGCCHGASPYTFIFERPRYRPVSDAQIAEWQEREAKVIALGGMMRGVYWQLNGEHSPFTAAECTLIRRAVAAQHQDLEVYDQWNGAGSYTFSVGARLKKAYQSTGEEHAQMTVTS